MGEVKLHPLLDLQWNGLRTLRGMGCESGEEWVLEVA